MIPVNEGTLDRIVRLLIGLVMIIVGFVALDGSAMLTVGIIGVLVFLTGLSGRCLIYRLINFNTLGVR
jgi:uncharacterized membrane protein